MKKIQILLSTYNGESYLKEQLNSYLAQVPAENIRVLVRDDGSTDGTLAILHEYRDKYGFTVIEGENIGYIASFHELIRLRDKSCELFAFSDQDDVWLPEKLARAEAALSECEGPTLFSCPSYITDEALNRRGTTLVAKRKPSFYGAIVQNICMGHNEVFNEPLAALAEEYFSPDMHMMDYWLYMLAASFGTVVYSPEPMTLYRQHGNNVIGHESGRVKRFFKRAKRAVTTRRAELHSRQLKAFIEACGDKLPEEYLRESERFLKRQKNFFTRLGYIFTTRARRDGFFENAVFRIMYLFGKYKIKTKKESKQ